MWRNPRPFLPGAAQTLSDDCDEACVQVRYFIHGYLYGRHRSTWSNVMQVMIKADRYTPGDHPRVAFFNLLINVIDRGSLWYKGKSRDRVEELEKLLVGMGFRLVPPACMQCGKPNDRSADDPTEKCICCVLAERTHSIQC
jgi:hypothetical protein